MSRLGGIALALSYAYTIGTVLRKRAPQTFAELAQDSWYKPISQLVEMIESNIAQYKTNPLLFLRGISVNWVPTSSAPIVTPLK